jgi:hypothetical protein
MRGQGRCACCKQQPDAASSLLRSDGGYSVPPWWRSDWPSPLTSVEIPCKTAKVRSTGRQLCLQAVRPHRGGGSSDTAGIYAYAAGDAALPCACLPARSWRPAGRPRPAAGAAGRHLRICSLQQGTHGGCRRSAAPPTCESAARQHVGSPHFLSGPRGRQCLQTDRLVSQILWQKFICFLVWDKSKSVGLRGKSDPNLLPILISTQICGASQIHICKPHIGGASRKYVPHL